jgi:putative phage-type endonuclease
MSFTILRPTSHQEWLELRKTGIGSSEVATIIGVNPYETPYQLWRRKTGQDAPIEENFFMKAGHYLEDAVAQFYSDESGREIIKRSATDFIIRNNDKTYLQVSPDRTYWVDKAGKKNHENKGIVECKTTQMTIDKNDLPKHWFSQLQYQLGVAELQQGSIAYLSQGRDFGYRDYAFAPDFYAWLIEEVERFWIDCIKGGQEPSAISVKDVLIKYNQHIDGKILEVDEDIFNAYNQLKDVRKELSAIEKQKDELEEKIKLAFTDAEAISYNGQTLATWKSPKASEKFDQKAFADAHPELVREFTKLTTGTRRFLIK